MDTYGEIIVKLDRILMILPHFSFPMSLPPEGGVVDAAVYARPPSRRRRPQPIEEGRPVSTFITDESFEKENPTSNSASELVTSGGAGRTKRWAGGTPPLCPNRCGGLRR